MGSKFKINCDEATTICNKNQYGEASFYEKLKLSFHIIFCKLCKTYSNQNNLLTKIFGNYAAQCTEKETLSPEEKLTLQKQVNQKLGL